VILRSSIIFGNLPPLSPITRGLFVQVLAAQCSAVAPCLLVCHGAGVCWTCARNEASVRRSWMWQWMDGALRGTEPIDFFNDEYRNPVFVQDILAVICKLCKLSIAGTYHRLQYP
jgi:dTDP-4-dehydrorhamnose reductase